MLTCPSLVFPFNTSYRCHCFAAVCGHFPFWIVPSSRSAPQFVSFWGSLSRCSASSLTIMNRLLGCCRSKGPANIICWRIKTKIQYVIVVQCKLHGSTTIATTISITKLQRPFQLQQQLQLPSALFTCTLFFQAMPWVYLLPCFYLPCYSLHLALNVIPSRLLPSRHRDWTADEWGEKTRQEHELKGGGKDARGKV